MIRDHCVLRVVGLRRAEQSLQREQCRADSKRRTPLILEDVQANCPCLGRDIGVPDLGLEAHFGRLVRVVRGDLDVYEEGAAVIRSVVLNKDIQVLELPLSSESYRRLRC